MHECCKVVFRGSPMVFAFVHKTQTVTSNVFVQKLGFVHASSENC